MRTLVVLLLLPAASLAQTPAVKYWPRLDIGFPVPPNVLKEDPKPVKLRLYTAPPGGQFRLAVEKAADNLDPIETDKQKRPPGFTYTAKGDGEEDFAVQLVYADGTVNSERADLKTQMRVVFDTRPPAVQLTTSGPYGVEWTVTDENASPDKITVEYRWSDATKWTAYTARSGGFRLKDGITWTALRNESKTLDVRVLAEDKAGHQGVSRVVRLPADATDRRVAEPVGDIRTGPSRSGIGDLPAGQPQIRYENTKALTVKPKIVHVTRSGVRKVHLFVKDMDAAAGEWKLGKTKDVNIEYETADPQVEIEYEAPADGRYGFIVIPESGAGRRDPDPVRTAPPQYLVEVDTTNPTVKIRDVIVTPGGGIGPRVEIVWDANDRNLLPDPIVLEYRSTKAKETDEWKLITDGKLPNSRRYVWEVADKALYEFNVRVRAVDQAGNSAVHMYEKKVNIDLDRPSATIENVRGAAGGGATTTPDKRN